MTPLPFPAAAPARDEATGADHAPGYIRQPETLPDDRARGGGSYLTFLKQTADRLHFAYVHHIDLECCERDLCQIGQWLQSEADAVGRRVAIAEGRAVMF